jgi:hypothetical protein
MAAKINYPDFANFAGEKEELNYFADRGGHNWVKDGWKHSVTA